MVFFSPSGVEFIDEIIINKENSWLYGNDIKRAAIGQSTKQILEKKMGIVHVVASQPNAEVIIFYFTINFFILRIW